MRKPSRDAPDAPAYPKGKDRENLKNPTYLKQMKEKTPLFRTGQYLYGAECICPVCGKHFWSGDDWAFVLFRTRGCDRNGDIRACSYSCLKKGQTDFEEHTRAVFARRARIFFRNSRTGEKLNVTALAKYLGVSDQTVRRAYRKNLPLGEHWMPEKKQSAVPNTGDADCRNAETEG